MYLCRRIGFHLLAAFTFDSFWEYKQTCHVCPFQAVAKIVDMAAEAPKNHRDMGKKWVT